MKSLCEHTAKHLKKLGTESWSLCKMAQFFKKKTLKWFKHVINNKSSKAFL